MGKGFPAFSNGETVALVSTQCVGWPCQRMTQSHKSAGQIGVNLRKNISLKGWGRNWCVVLKMRVAQSQITVLRVTSAVSVTQNWVMFKKKKNLTGNLDVHTNCHFASVYFDADIKTYILGWALIICSFNHIMPIRDSISKRCVWGTVSHCLPLVGST